VPIRLVLWQHGQPGIVRVSHNVSPTMLYSFTRSRVFAQMELRPIVIHWLQHLVMIQVYLQLKLMKITMIFLQLLLLSVMVHTPRWVM